MARPRIDPVVAVCVLVLLAFPLAAIAGSARQPVQPPALGALTAPAATAPAGAVRDLPLVSSRDRRATAPPRLRAAVVAAADRVLGGPRRRALLRYLDGEPLHSVAQAADYPFRFRGLTALVAEALPARPAPEQARAAAELGGLLALAEDADAFPNAGQAAFAVLDRARATGGCDAQLNLAFLVAASHAEQADQNRELRAAVAACPRDPTALWLYGQELSTSGFEPAADSRRAIAVFAELQRRMPGSAAGWSGEGDALLRRAYLDELERRPFSARVRFARALARYRRAVALDDAPELGAGVARALAGLGLHAEAARVQARAAVATRRPAVLQARLVEYLERAGRFAGAATEAGRLAADARFPRGPALVMASPSPDSPLYVEDALEPLSAGAGRLKPVTLDILPSGFTIPFGGAGSVEDVSFIPLFRPVPGVTGVDRWCPSWSRRRDALAAGRPRAALADMPARFRTIGDSPARPPGRVCVDVEGSRMLAAVARAEAGDHAGAVRAAGLRSGELYGARQDLWRFARRWDKARAVTARWRRARPRDPRAADRAGEIEFLAGDHAAAARAFDTAARLAREQSAGWSPDEALALVKRGTALKRAGRFDEALDALRAGDEVASRALVHVGREQAGNAIYHARSQAADVALRRRRFADAVDEYAAARRFARPRTDAEQVVEVVDNNLAIAEVFAGRPDRGLRAARRAVASDPLNPLFRQTEGFALARLGRPREAAIAYRRAVAADPSLFPAWNDLGVMLARSGRDREAVDALRRAVGVRRGYATAWFNLGVTLERLGPRQWPAAQGALARAVRLDGELRARERTLLTDERLYVTNLDLSKPLPPEWDFASSQRGWAVPSIGFALVLLLGLQGARAAAARGVVAAAPKWLEAVRDLLARLPRTLASLTPSAVAVAVTVAVFLWPAIRGVSAGASELVLLAAGLLALVALVMRVRALAARAVGVTVRQRGWGPALVLAPIVALAGIQWAPLPVADSGEPPQPRVHLAGPAVAGAAGLVLVVLSAWVEVPVTRALGVAALVMAASMLTPIAPLDGARLKGAATAWSAGLALAGVAVLLALGLL